MVVQTIAVQIRWTFLVLGLISLGFSIDLGHIQNQVHRRGAKVAEGFFVLVIQSQEAFGSQTPCLRQSNQARFSGYGAKEEVPSHTVRGFLFGGLLPPNKKIASSASSASQR